MNRITAWVHDSVAHLYRKVRENVRRWFAPVYRTQIAEESLPRHLHNHTLYIVQEDGFREQAALLCPCGCGRTLHLNLLPDERPCWTLTLHSDGTSTLHPSVWRQKDCRSHFWFRHGRVVWCAEEGA